MDEKLTTTPGNERVRKIHECVNRVKSSEEMGVKYMQTWEEKVIERQEGKAEGKAEDIIELLLDVGTVSDDLRAHIMAEKDLKTLKEWLKIAAKAENEEAFRRETGI